MSLDRCGRLKRDSGSYGLGTEVSAALRSLRPTLLPPYAHNLKYIITQLPQERSILQALEIRQMTAEQSAAYHSFALISAAAWRDASQTNLVRPMN